MANISDQINQAGVYLKAEAFAAFEKAKKAAEDLANQIQPTTPGPAIPNPDLTKEEIQDILAKGVTPEKANQLLARDISNNEHEVKKVLSSAGVKNIPQGAFDGLVSMQNQLGDIRYVYIKGEKIDLTPLYSSGNWDAVASFVAADERDRPRRIREAAMIAKNDYGPNINEDSIIERGLANAAESLAKGSLNKQTGDPATDQQTFALANSYFGTTGETLPDSSTSSKLAVVKNIAEEFITKRYRRQAGPWPY